MAEFKNVAKLSELKEGEVAGIIGIEGEQLALYRIGDEVFATSDLCTHAECVISENFGIEGEEVECTCHGSKFNVKSGEVTQSPAVEPLKTYPVKIEGDDVLVEI